MSCFRLILLMLLLLIPKSAYSAPDVETVYTAALASAAAYDDKLSRFATVRLEQQGWKIKRFTRESTFVDAQFLLAAKEVPSPDGVQTQHILAFRGTEKSLKDIVTDLAAELIFFYPSPTRLVSVAYDNKQIDAGVLVHRGFQAYAETALSIPALDGADSSLIDILKAQQTSLIITGHSLGGAAATVFGAMLLEGGVPAERIQVISFGAPPVGNLGFSNRYSNLPLIRVVNPHDLVAHLTGPVPDGAKRLPEYTELLNYVHFGEVLQNPVSIQDELRQHPIRVYIDYAARARLQTGLTNPTDKIISVKITNNAIFSGGHAPYMTLAVEEILSKMLAGHEHTGMLPAGSLLDVIIEGRQLQSSSDGWVSVSIIAKRRSDEAFVWAASRHVSLLEEMSPLAGAMLAADMLSRQFVERPPCLDMPVPFNLSLKI